MTKRVERRFPGPLRRGVIAAVLPEFVPMLGGDTAECSWRLRTESQANRVSSTAVSSRQEHAPITSRRATRCYGEPIKV